MKPIVTSAKAALICRILGIILVALAFVLFLLYSGGVQLVPGVVVIILLGIGFGLLLENLAYECDQTVAAMKNVTSGIDQAAQNLEQTVGSLEKSTRLLKQTFEARRGAKAST